jgi:aminoglycoside/choline kinase family phosphotransferase
VLDHQDLRLGPPQYDLASLLNDSLFPTAPLEEQILSSVLGDDPALRRGYHRAAVQRTLKASGTYESFALRGFPRHRRLIPPTLERAVRHLAQLPEASGLVRELDDRLSLVIC